MSLKPKPKLSGGARLMSKGLKPVFLGLTVDEHALLRQEAQKQGIPYYRYALLALREKWRREGLDIFLPEPLQ